MSDEQIKLKPCPFCNSDRHEMWQPEDQWDSDNRVQCLGCGALGPEGAATEEEAREKWNTRRGEAEIEQMRADFKRARDTILAECDRLRDETTAAKMQVRELREAASELLGEWTKDPNYDYWHASGSLRTSDIERYRALIAEAETER